MPNNIFFEPLWMNIDILIGASSGAGTAAGAVDDVAKLVYTGRGTRKSCAGPSNYPQIPISYCHASGGPIGGISASLTAPANLQYAVNGAQDSGYSVADSFMISPMVPFAVILTWAAAQTIASATPRIRCSFDGNWYLPVFSARLAGIARDIRSTARGTTSRATSRHSLARAHMIDLAASSTLLQS